MLKELNREEWLSILRIPEEHIPEVLILRGTRNLKVHYQHFQQFFTDILEVGSPNNVLEDVFIGNYKGCTIAYATVYGAPMASEVAHAFGAIGTSLVIQTGCCGAISAGLHTGDIFIPTEAYRGEGASQYYAPSAEVLPATLDVAAYMPPDLPADIPLHFGRIYTTSALFAEGEAEIELWRAAGYQAVDMETAAMFAVANYFNMRSASLLYVFDNPSEQEHIFQDDNFKQEKRSQGNQMMARLALHIAANYCH